MSPQELINAIKAQDQRIEDLFAEQERIRDQRSAQVEQLVQARGKSPIIINGNRHSICVRGGRYFLREFKQSLAEEFGVTVDTDALAMAAE